MAHKIKGLGWRRGFNDPRDYTPEHPEVKKILQSAAAASNNKKGEKLDTANLPKKIDNKRYLYSNRRSRQFRQVVLQMQV